ncbi:two-component sensor histidine kinase [Thalassotalea profundi]|uniref:histidine kinase n=2 Tax=Thalassotalea profundi TaxID=2036687 RepID=A0ABQ3IM24_9GAMM|nr:two-component sensor histidine kinase [Thalassotalea profundi]
MVDYVNSKEIQALAPTIAKLSQIYQQENSWRVMENKHQGFHQLISKQLEGSAFSPRPINPMPRYNDFHERPPIGAPIEKNNRLHGNETRRIPPPPKENMALYALLNNEGDIVAGRYIESIDYSKTPIKIDTKTIGYLAVSKRKHLTEGYEVDFLEQQRSYLWLIAMLSMGLVALITFPLSRHVVEPIKLIAKGMHKLTQGEYQQSIDLKRKDELGELSRDYNELALTLSENDKARKRWLANISHELRTPVAILRGELEAMLDDVRPITKSNIASAADEVKHLQHLIDDLSLLTSTDIGGMRYRKQNENLTAVLTSELDKYDSYLSNAGITLTRDITTKNIITFIDKTRLFQLLENIINNCIKYSHATEFKLSLTYKNANNMAILTLEDNGNGVDKKHMPHLFEYLYRVDDSRNRSMGGSGLGLSICHNIVMAHQGDIKAEISSLGGLAIIIQLPAT